MTENLSEQDIRDLKSMGIDPETEQPGQRSLLLLWTNVLSNIESIAAQPIPALAAHRVVTTWPKLSYQDTAIYHVRYHELLLEMRDVLTDMISDLPEERLGYAGEKDAEENGQTYLDILVAWNIILDEHESSWNAEDDYSHIDIAVMSEVRAFLFSEMGLAGHLSAIGFSVDNDTFMTALNDARAAVADDTKEG